MNGFGFFAVVICLMDMTVIGDEIKLEQTFYYDGNMQAQQWTQNSIDVDADGTVAVALNRTVGSFNSDPTYMERWLVLLYDKSGEPIGKLASPNSGMVDVTFGPDGRVYTGESWFGSGTHIYDRPGAKERWVPVRFLKADGSHPDRGCPRAVAVGSDYRIYTIFSKDNRIYAISPEDKVIQTFEPSGRDKLDITPEGTLFSGDKVLQADGTWKDFKYFVRDTRPDGKMLVQNKQGWAIYDYKSDHIEKIGVYPPGDWSNVALGPDDNVYLVPRNNSDIAYVIADADGKMIMTRGADFDHLTVILPDKKLTSGQSMTIKTTTQRSRELGYVPKSVLLPYDNRPELKLFAFLSPIVNDQLSKQEWSECLLNSLGNDTYSLQIPEKFYGNYRLKFSATPLIDGLKFLEVSTDVMIQPASLKLYLSPKTYRGRIGFVAGEPIRITVPVSPSEDIDLSKANLVLGMNNKVIIQTPLGLDAVSANTNHTAVITIPSAITRCLRPAIYEIMITNLPDGVGSDKAIIEIVSLIHETLFQTPMHPIGDGYINPIKDAQMHAQIGATHIVNPTRWDPIYLDVATRLGITFHYQLHSHYSPLNVLPQEQGAAKQYIANLAQKMLPYPSFRGFNYHDLQVQPYGQWGDVGRKDYYEPLWAEWAKEVNVPETVPPERKQEFARRIAMESMLDRLYKSFGDAISHVDPRLDRTTMQWWHQPLTVADPDHVSKYQNLISTQHMEEQYYHAVTVANQADLWKRPDKDLWVYGNTTWQEDGTGASMFTDFMAMLFRGVQGAGRNELPRAGDLRSEALTRTATDAFRMMHVYGGLSAIAEPDDKIAIWRSFYQSAAEKQSGRQLATTTSAYTACLYAHRTAVILTDDLVRDSELMKYKAVIISFEVPLPADLSVKLQEFMNKGGIVLANNPGESYWHPEGAIELGQAFGDSHALAHSNRDSLRHIGIEEDGLNGAPILLKALGNRIQPLVDCDDPTTWISVLKSGKSKYIYTVNLKRLPQPPMDLHRYSGYENTRMPTETLLSIQKGKYFIYDVFAGKEVKPQEKDCKWVVKADMTVFPGSIFALLPAQIDHLNVQVGKSTDNSLLHINVKVADAKNVNIEAGVPLEIVVRDTAGKTRYHIYRTTKNGLWEESLPIAMNDVSGRWTIEVTELLSGKRLSGTVMVKTPTIPNISPTPKVEWSNTDRIAESLQTASKIGIIVDDKQVEPLASALDAIQKILTNKGKQTEVIKSSEYLADRKELLWDKFRFGELGTADIKLRPKKYDLIVTLDIPNLPSGIIPSDIMLIPLKSDDPGEGRGFVQYVVMPVYDTEDAVSLVGGDLDGLMSAVNALKNVPKSDKKSQQSKIALKDLSYPKKDVKAVKGISEFIGIPISELAISNDGKRIAVGLKGWGDNLIFLNSDGSIINKHIAGKFFPLQIQALDNGFAVLSHENDPTTLYQKLYDKDGNVTMRVSATGRRVGGARDWSASQPEVIDRFLKQASFSITPNGRFCAVGGSKAIAVWDLANQKVIWRDDSINYDKGGFPQLKLSDDGNSLVLQYDNSIIIRDGRTGTELYRVSLPTGSSMGRIRFFDGKNLVVGDDEFFAFSEGKLLWHWKAPRYVIAICFAKDALHYAIGEVDGTIRLMEGGRQIGGYMSPSGGMITSLDISQDMQKVAFSNAIGLVGVLNFQGRVLWQENLRDRATIKFAGINGDTVIGDQCGRLRMFGSSGKLKWMTDFTPQAYRTDTVKLLTAPDDTYTLRLNPPSEPKIAIPKDKANLAENAKVTFIEPRSWWNEPIKPDRSVSLIDGEKDSPKDGWFDRTKLEYVAFVPSPPAWELTWEKPVTINCLLIYESPEHPEAIPEEIKIETWIDDGWKEILHSYWNQGIIHAHYFPTITATKVRYTPVGDLANNVWLSEIEIYNTD